MRMPGPLPGSPRHPVRAHSGRCSSVVQTANRNRNPPQRHAPEAKRRARHQLAAPPSAASPHRPANGTPHGRQTQRSPGPSEHLRKLAGTDRTAIRLPARSDGTSSRWRSAPLAAPVVGVVPLAGDGHPPAIALLLNEATPPAPSARSTDDRAGGPRQVTTPVAPALQRAAPRRNLLRAARASEAAVLQRPSMRP